MVNAMEVDSEYGDVHRLFLQTCANHGTQTIPQAIKILMHIKRKYEANGENARAPNENDLRQLVTEINAKLAVLEQSLEFIIMDLDMPCDEFLVFKSGSHSSGMKIPSDMTDEEGKYFKIIMEYIVTNSVHYVPSMNALNLSIDFKMTKMHADELLARWSSQGYFTDIESIYFPGPRLISEFDDILRTKFKDCIRSCFLCKQISFQGQECPHECECLIHKRCMLKYFKKSKRCPKCKQDWQIPSERDM